MRSRVPLFALLLVAGSLALPLAAHAAIPFFGPIIDPNVLNPRCALGWGAVMIVINNIISFSITIAIVFVAPLMIAYAGFLYVVNPVNASGISEAKKILTNTVVGIVIALAGWLIVDAIMAVLYNANTPNPTGGGVLGTWSNLVTSGGEPFCLIQEGALQRLSQATAPSGVTVGVPQVGRARGPCADGNTACSIGAIRQAAQALNMTLSSAQVTTMSCIAMTESSGNPSTPNSNTGACGTFQITTRPGNWSIPGLHRSPCSTSSSCNDAQCNMQTALLLYSQRGYQPWTGRNPDGTYWNPNAVACAQQYDLRAPI
ncbi:MAG: hypothetical protein AAB850_02375 [Patescibacteria group bacterium]